MSSEAPYFPFYPRDWMADPKVQLMTWREEWAYFKLLMLCWTYDGTCTLPNDDRKLARLLGLPAEEWAEIRAVLIDGDAAVFQVTDDGSRIYNRRLMREWEQMLDKSAKARKAAQVRWQRGGTSDRNANAMRTHNGRIADAERTQCHPDPDADADPDDADDDNARARVKPTWPALFQRVTGGAFSSLAYEQFCAYADELGDDLVAEALRRAGIHARTDPADYALRILRDWSRHGARSLDDVARLDEAFERRKRTATRARADPDDAPPYYDPLPEIDPDGRVPT